MLLSTNCTIWVFWLWALPFFQHEEYLGTYYEHEKFKIYDTLLSIRPGRIKAIEIKTGNNGMRKGYLKVQICSSRFSCCKISKLGKGEKHHYNFRKNTNATFVGKKLRHCNKFSLPSISTFAISLSRKKHSWTGEF